MTKRQHRQVSIKEFFKRQWAETVMKRIVYRTLWLFYLINNQDGRPDMKRNDSLFFTMLCMFWEGKQNRSENVNLLYFSGCIGLTFLPVYNKDLFWKNMGCDNNLLLVSQITFFENSMRKDECIWMHYDIHQLILMILSTS